MATDFRQRLYGSYLFTGATLVEVGGGKNPLISLSEKPELGLRVIGLDISTQEMNFGPCRRL